MKNVKKDNFKTLTLEAEVNLKKISNNSVCTSNKTQPITIPRSTEKRLF
jgi:hypothetical protein